MTARKPSQHDEEFESIRTPAQQIDPTWPDSDGYVGPSPDELHTMLLDLNSRVQSLEHLTATIMASTDCTCKALERHSGWHEDWCPIGPYLKRETTEIEFGGEPF